MMLLDVVSRIVHVGTAIVLVGGTSFMLFLLIPAAMQLPSEAHDKLRTLILGRWKRFVHGGIALFLLSGFYNYYQAVQLHKGDSLYHALVGTKILLALVLFFIASALVGQSKAFAKMRANRPRWLCVLVLLAVVIVSISGFVKVRGVPAAAPPPAVSQ